MKLIRLISACAPLLAAMPSAGAQEIPAPGEGSLEHRADVQITGHIFKPVELPAPDLAKLKIADGFRIEKFAENLGNARLLAVTPDGTVYVTRREQGDILMLKPGPNGLAAGPAMRAASRAGLHGLTFHQGKAYIATVHEIFRAEILPDGTFGTLEMLVHDLPDAGQHHTRTVQFGPDGMMYVSVGSTCNECAEPNPENATLLRIAPDGKTRSIFAAGLRDTIGWGWHPRTGELWGMDHGMDWLGDDLQPEELNKIEEGGHYGWPYFFADNKANPHLDPPAGVEKSDWAKIVVPMTAGYTAHAAPMQMSFYNGTQFPAEYRGDAFISMRGSWNRKPASGYEILRIRFKDGQPAGFEPFVTGFLTDEGQHGRLCGNAVAKDGSLLFTDDRNGVIYRVSHPAGAEKNTLVSIADAKPPQVVELPVTGPLAIDAPAAKTKGKLKVTTPAYKQGAPIPLIYSAYDQNASIPLKWSAGPEGTKSYVILMDDPDAKVTKLPVSHWVVWNVPGDVTGLREGLEPGLRLKDPKGLCQGKNYSGKPGYAGPRPAVGDPPHTYHIQVFALDQTLDLPLGSKRERVLDAMTGKVLAAGDLTGEFKRPDEPAKP